MITLKLKKTRHVPNRWNELSEDQFVRLAGAIADFENGTTNFEQFKVMSVAAILDLKINRLKMTDTLYENLFRISEQLSFPYTLHEKEDHKEVEFKICINRQMQPKVKQNKGYVFTVDSGMIETTIVSEQYVDAISVMKLYSSDHSKQGLDMLVKVLYCPLPYSKENMQKVKLHQFSRAQKLAVYYNFRGLLEWIKRIDKYDIIFNSAEDKPGKSPIGMEGSLYSLSKAGYGVFRDICKIDLFTYLDLLLSQTIESIHTLKGCGLKPTEIAEKLNLTVGQISSVAEL
jgi:hypothetical protein